MKITYEFDTSEENFDLYEHEAYKQAEQTAYAISLICSKFRDWDRYGSFPKKEKVKEEDIIFEGQREYVEDLNAFIEKYPNTIADVNEMRQEIIDILYEAGVNTERLGI